MTTLFGVLLLVGGFTVLAVVRPWQSDDRAPREVDPPVKGGFPPSRPRPGPRRGAALTRAAEAGAAGAGAAGSSAGAAGETASGAVRGSATGLAARRPSPVRGVPAEASGAVRGSVADVDGLEVGLVADVDRAARGSSEEASSPVVALKPRPAARRAEPRGERAPLRHHRVESIQRGRRVSAEPGDTEIVLPEWLGPMSVPGDDAAPVRARHAG
ncbi:hypothetical protein ACFQZ4_28580 [Catellatospora coxensis]|uniref:Uncharacterized protein n=1 Tax=Catellatospora coxensis TaxID=310354 RepID=A0A8J3L1H9_9ACTN|nr:hypothetical protein [Catellatospora coxensis]GIG06891.1 hypothetical protein Cco03nite_35910 [Catellatospora coxensis]